MTVLIWCEIKKRKLIFLKLLNFNENLFVSDEYILKIAAVLLVIHFWTVKLWKDRKCCTTKYINISDNEFYIDQMLIYLRSLINQS